MRLFSVSTPKSSPELVRHSLVSRQSAAAVAAAGEAESPHSMPDRPVGNSPGLVRGVSTLGRKVSRRFEKFGESETARRLRMASPSRKYQWAIAGGGDATSPARGPGGAVSDDIPSKSPKQKSRVSRVDSFRNFFSLVQPSSSSNNNSNNHSHSSASTLRTPRAVKRRSKNGGERRSARLQLVDAATSTTGEEMSARHNLSAPNSLSNGLNSRFGSSSAELAMIMAGSGGPGAAGDGFSELSECQSEADLRYYNYCTTEDEDDNSVASEGFLRSSLLRSNSKSAGNLRLAMLPENRTVCNFPDRSSAIQIKDYGMIDAANVARKEGDAGSGVGKNSNESGYSSSDNNSNGTSPNSSSRASPRASLDGEQEQQQQPSPPLPKEARSPPHSSLSVPPKKPARTSKLNASRSRSLEQAMAAAAPAVSVATKDYKMVRLAKRSLSDELGIIIAKKKLKEINTTGFHIVHIEPGGMVDRQVNDGSIDRTAFLLLYCGLACDSILVANPFSCSFWATTRLLISGKRKPWAGSRNGDEGVSFSPFPSSSHRGNG